MRVRTNPTAARYCARSPSLTRPVSYLLVVLALLGRVAFRRSQVAQEWQRPHTSRLGYGHQEHQAHPHGRLPSRSAPGWSARGGGRLIRRRSSCPSASAGFHRGRSPAGRRPGESLREQAQQHTTRLSPRPIIAVEDTRVALEVLDLSQANHTLCATNGPLARSEDRSFQ